LFASEFYQPLRADSRIFVAPSIVLEQRNFNVFDGDEAIAQLRLSDATLALDLGAELGTIGEFRVGVFRGISNARVKVGTPAIADADVETGGVQTSLRIDTRDNARFPRSGTQADFAWRLSRPNFGADRRYQIAEFDVDTAWSRGKSTLVLGLQFGSSLDTESTLQDHFALGGFLRLSGLERGQLLGPYAGLARAVYYRRVGESAGGLIEVPVYLGASLEAGNAWSSSDDIGFDSLLTNGSVFIGMDTYFGPVYLAAGFAEGGRTNFYLFVGAAPR
jgi:NTE family protein